MFSRLLSKTLKARLYLSFGSVQKYTPQAEWSNLQEYASKIRRNEKGVNLTNASSEDMIVKENKT
jgi:hypothetical protein